VPSAASRGITGQFTAGNGGYLLGPPHQWVEQLLPSVLDDGVGTFVLATDHQLTLQRFAAEVIPALRAAVSAGRALPPPAEPPPGTQAITRHDQLPSDASL
jgi:alkanesulfonate monooxygenase SsuD/methylene tetrahydromethanopterin reductase-like flavin-dependent oxidoreductase (luciferase family)